MAGFACQRIRQLEEDLIRVTKEKNELESKVLKLFAFEGEFENYIVDKLALDNLQASKLKLIFSEQQCRLYGLPEDMICKYDDWERVYKV